jgi:hypothetical protein
MRAMKIHPRIIAAVHLVALGCGPVGPVAPVTLPPVIVESAVESNPHNVLSALVSTRVRLADSVAVRLGIVGEPLKTLTPGVIPVGDSAVVPVLGLLPETRYTFQIVAFHRDGIVSGNIMGFTTGPLPDDLPTYVAGGPDPSPGYVAFAAGSYGLVIDNSGRVVWYHRFANGPGLNFQAQPTGRYVARPPSQPAVWVEIDPLGNVSRTMQCAGGLQTRFHDLLHEPDGSYWMLCDETRVMDLSHLSGVNSARVLGTGVQRLSETGELLFAWSPFDHFELTDLAPEERAGPIVNWTHGNALDLDPDGNLLVSFRSLSEITKIDTRTGEVLWRMGGLRNQFAFPDTTALPFARQHGVRATGTGRLLLLDNLGNPAESRAERLLYDESARTARLTGSYGSLPPVVAELGGTTQDLPGGRTLVSFGSAERVEEYDEAGHVTWRMEAPGYVFRAQRILSLYRPGVGSPR